MGINLILLTALSAGVVPGACRTAVEASCWWPTRNADGPSTGPSGALLVWPDPEAAREQDPAAMLVASGPPYWRTRSFLVLLAINLCAITVLAYYQRLHKLNAKQQALEIFSRRLIESQEAERKRIAAELHDSLGQNLVVIRNQALMALQQNPGESREHLMEISATASQAIEEVRTIAYALRPYHLDRMGLTRAAESLVKRVSASSGIRFSSNLERVDGLFSPESETSIYRILQESVNNIVRHSAASEASVGILRQAGSVSITVADNGVGFVLNPAKTGLGLVSITERVRLLGGTSEIVSAPGAGTSITICIDC